MSEALAAVRPAHMFGAEVRLEPYGPGGGLPLFIHAEREDLRTDEDAAVAWYHAHQAELDRLSTEVGAVVLRGFALKGSAAFDRAVANYPEMQFGYTAGATPRSAVQGRVYEATRAPAATRIPLHQEMSYLPDYPARLAFFCVAAPETGGETSIGDARKFSTQVPAAMWQALERHGGVRYVRNFRAPDWSCGDTDLDITHRPWTEALGVDDRAAAEAECRKMGLEWEWHDNGSISVSNVLPGHTVHPATGKALWFNQMTIQVMNERTRGAEQMARIERAYGLGVPRPYDARFADDTAVGMDLLEPVYQAEAAARVDFPWQAGDLMLLDNIHTFHGRNPFTGHRDVQVALLG